MPVRHPRRDPALRPLLEAPCSPAAFTTNTDPDIPRPAKPHRAAVDTPLTSGPVPPPPGLSHVSDGPFPAHDVRRFRSRPITLLQAMPAT